MITSQQRVREELQEELGFPLPDKAWDYLVKMCLVEDVMIGTKGIDELADNARELLEAAGAPIVKRQPAAPRMRDPKLKKAAAERLDAVSVLLAQDARGDPQVEAFRKDALKGHLLPWEDVDRWIRQQAERDGPSTRWLRVPVPAECTVEWSGHHPVPNPPFLVSEEHPPLGVSTELLAYAAPGEHGTRRVPVARDGVLGHLRTLSVSLAKHYRWQEAQATVFVLTNIVPLVSHLQIDYQVNSPFTATSRVVLTIDSALSPREVANAYRKVRKELLGSRHRNLTEKHLRLAVFAAERPKSETWRQKMAAWNGEHPEWKYTRETNFARDCEKARDRLLRPSVGRLGFP